MTSAGEIRPALGGGERHFVPIAGLGCGGDPLAADGWLTATIPIESFEHALGDLLRLGAEAEVVAPPELHSRMAATVCPLTSWYVDDSQRRGARAVLSWGLCD